MKKVKKASVIVVCFSLIILAGCMDILVGLSPNTINYPFHLKMIPENLRAIPSKKLCGLIQYEWSYPSDRYININIAKEDVIDEILRSNNNWNRDRFIEAFNGYVPIGISIPALKCAWGNVIVFTKQRIGTPLGEQQHVEMKNKYGQTYYISVGVDNRVKSYMVSQKY